MSMLWPDITTWPDITDWPGDDTGPVIPPVSTLLRPEATLTLTVDDDTLVVDVMDGRVTLDDTGSPYVQAELTIPWSTISDAEKIDPRETQRALIEVEESIGGSSRTFDLALRGRRIGHHDRRIVVEAASDEALLMDMKLLADTPDTTPRTYESSFRDVCDWALDKIGAALEAGTDDADLTATWAVSNLFPNPGSENSSALGWVPSTGTPTVTSQTTPVKSGTRCVRIEATAASAWIAAEQAVSVTPGRTYRASLQLRSSVARFCQVILQWSGPDGQLGINSNGVTAISSTSAWTEYKVSGEAPVGATQVRLLVVTSGNAAGNFHYIDEVMLYQDEEEVPWFTGATTDTDDYTYSWSGDTDASASERTPVTPRPREMFAWRPGESLWDFLQPLMEASGLRLFCDEERAWRLVDLSTYETSGLVVVQEKVNAVEGEDEITRNDDSWGTGVVAHYQWTDRDGVQQEAYDYAGTDEKVVTVEYDTAYPGPGAAAALLKMFSGRGRTQSTSRLVDYTATPGMSALITLPGTLPQSGKVSGVEFDLKAGVMGVSTRALTEITPGSWADVDADLEWDDTGTTDVDWKDWT